MCDDAEARRALEGGGRRQDGSYALPNVRLRSGGTVRNLTTITGGRERCGVDRTGVSMISTSPHFFPPRRNPANPKSEMVMKAVG